MSTARTTGPDPSGRWRRGRLLPSLLPLTILANPFQWVIGLLSMILGGGVVVTEAFGLGAFTRTQMDLPLLVATSWGALMFIGGSITVHAMRRHDDKPALYGPLESAALMILGCAWLVFAISPFFVRNGVYSTTIVGALLAVACLMRVHAIAVVNKVTKEASALHQEVTR